MADGDLNVAAALATLRGEMAAGFARLEGQLNLISQAQDNAAKDIDAVNDRVESLEGRVSDLEARRWPMGPLMAITAVVGAIAAVATYFATR